MPAPRRKAPKLHVPQTIDEATALLGDYADLVTHAELIRADADRSIAAIQAARDEALAPIEERAKDHFRQLRGWWSVAAPAMTEGKRKSIELSGCVIGERTPPPSLTHKGLLAAEGVALLLGAKLGRFVRVTTALDKPEIVKALRVGAVAEADAGHQETAAQLGRLGFAWKQEDELFIDRAQPEPADPVVQVEEAA